jgi:hypothetical protein
MLDLLRGECGADRACPNISRDVDRCVWVVQGYTVDATTVAVPAGLVPEWTGVLPAGDSDMLLVTGQPVTDRATLAQFALPVGESVVELALAELPTLPVEV